MGGRNAEARSAPAAPAALAGRKGKRFKHAHTQNHPLEHAHPFLGGCGLCVCQHESANKTHPHQPCPVHVAAAVPPLGQTEKNKLQKRTRQSKERL